jgi:uncharacterized protein
VDFNSLTNIPLSFLIILLILGVCFGIINTLAGGGSTLSLPVMLFLGLSPHMANATNRLAGIVQTVSAVIGFMQQGKFKHPVIKYLVLYSFTAGSLGAYCSLLVSPIILNYWIQVCIAGVAIFLLVTPNDWVDKDFPVQSQVSRHLVGLLIAFYGGFLQAGVGIICFYYLRIFWGLSSIDSIVMKVLFIAIFTIPAMFIFTMHAQIHWLIGGILALGSAFGAFLGVKLSLSVKGSQWIRTSLPLAALLMVIGLLIKMYL